MHTWRGRHATTRPQCMRVGGQGMPTMGVASTKGMPPRHTLRSKSGRPSPSQFRDAKPSGRASQTDFLRISEYLGRGKRLSDEAQNLRLLIMIEKSKFRPHRG